MWQSLEHVHDPQEVLSEARRTLAPGGKLIVATPNIDSLPFRWFGHAWYGLDLPRHLTHLAAWTLRLMLHRARLPRRSGFAWSATAVGCVECPGRLLRALQQRLAPLATQGARPRTLATWFSYVTRQCDCMTATAWRR